MFDEFRQEADEYSFEDTLDAEDEPDVYAFKDGPAPKKRSFLGMTPVQRFVIAVLLLMMTCILSSFFLLVTERIAPPFLS
jgi:hypothetical protein